VRQQAKEKDIALLLQIPRTLQPVQVDPERISQVISNLLANALKFTERGQIIVRVQPLVAGTTVRRWRAPAGGAVQVSVSDTGVGIAPEAMDKLFQRFYQGMYTLQNKPKGTGLGLAICQEIVHHYGGIIWAESTPDVGSTFHFTLPVS
jgi:signal transduction histidine kinase